MQVHTLTDGECRAILAGSTFGRLACSKDDQPYVVPVYFYVEDNYLYSFATLGQKIEWMRANPKVCVEIDDVSDVSHWTSLVAFGYYEELPPTPQYAEVRRRALAMFEKRGGIRPPRRVAWRNIMFPWCTASPSLG
jgi:uncharacterized protein